VVDHFGDADVVERLGFSRVAATVGPSPATPAPTPVAVALEQLEPGLPSGRVNPQAVDEDQRVAFGRCCHVCSLKLVVFGEMVV